MAKGGVGYATTKAIANQIKSKGLQKLRWYCQMCQKQCRDDNGFKNHCASESHQRNMIHFSENTGRYLHENSRLFQNAFVKLLSHRHSTNRIHANLVYQEYIADKSHIHLSGTRWGSVREFCHYLGRQGIAKVDETDKGIFLEWIDTSPGLREKQQALEKKMRLEKSEAERDEKMLQDMIKHAHEKASMNDSNDKQGSTSASTSIVAEATELKRENTTAPIKLSMNPIKKFNGLDSKKRLDLKKVSVPSSSSSKAVAVGSSTSLKRPLTALEEIKLKEEELKKRRQR